jgi:hypothetical protein
MEVISSVCKTWAFNVMQVEVAVASFIVCVWVLVLQWCEVE